MVDKTHRFGQSQLRRNSHHRGRKGRTARRYRRPSQCYSQDRRRRYLSRYRLDRRLDIEHR